MTGDRATLQAQYVALSPHRAGLAGPAAVVALPVPEPYGQRRVAGYAIEKSLPDGVGAFVALAAQRERVDGHRADDARRAADRGADSSRGTSASCSAASSTSATT